MEIEGCDTTREELTKRIPELREQSQLSAADATKVRELNQKVGKCKSDMASCAMLASKLEADVARLQKAILDAGGSKLKKQQAACEKSLANLDAAEKALNTAKVTITSAHKAAAKAKEAKATADRGLEECKGRMEERQSEFKALEADALKVMQAYEKVKAVEAEKRLALEEVTKECEELKKSTSEIKCIEIDLLGKVEAFDKQIGECERRVNHFKQEISKLRSAEKEDDDFDDSDDESENEAENNEDGADKGEADVEMEEAEESAQASAEPKDTAVASGSRSSLPTLQFASLEQYDIEEVKDDILTLERERSTLAKNANMGAIAEYRKKEADYLSR
jgi:structural maintenance of chromosome 4